MSRSLIWSLSDLLIAYHLNVRIGLSAYHTGILLFGSSLFGAFLDIVVATIVSRLNDPLRSTLRLQAMAGCVTVAAALALFGPTPDGKLQTLIYLAAVSLVFRAAYAVMDVTQNALTSLLPESREQLSTFVSTRTIVSSVGRLGASGLVYIAMERSTDGLADFKAVAAIAIPVVVSVIALSFVKTARSLSAIEPASWRSVPYRRLAAPLIAVVGDVAVFGLVGPIMALVPSSASGQSLLLTMVCGTVIGPLLIGKRGNRLVATIPYPLVKGFCAVGILLPTPTWCALSLAFMFGAAQAAVTNMIWQRVGSVVHNVACTTGRRIDIAAFATLTGTIKLGIAAAGGLLALQLDPVRSGSTFGLASTAGLFALGAFLTAFALSIDILPKRRVAPSVSAPVRYS